MRQEYKWDFRVGKISRSRNLGSKERKGEEKDAWEMPGAKYRERSKVGHAE